MYGFFSLDHSPLFYLHSFPPRRSSDLACPQAFALEYAVPALTSLQRRHPGLQVELITATQRARQYRSGVDIEVVVGRPDRKSTRLISSHVAISYAVFCLK